MNASGTKERSARLYHWSRILPTRQRWRDPLIAIVAVLLVAGFALYGYQIRRTKHQRVTFGDVRYLVTAIRQYFQEYRAFGTTDNASIMHELRGANTREIVFFDAPTNSFDAKGEFVDRWGTPFRIDVSNPRVWSCGPDRKDDGGKAGSDDIVSWR